MAPGPVTTRFSTEAEKIMLDTLPAIRELLEESQVLLCVVDLIDLSRTDEEFRQKVIREGILWTD